MSASYANIALTAPNPEIQRLISLHGGLAEIRSFQSVSWDGIEGRKAGLGFVREAKLGKLLWPNGASRWAIGHFVATQAQLNDIVKIIKPNLQDQQPASSEALRIWDEANPDDDTEIAPQMYLLSPWPLFQHDDADSDLEKFWLLTFVDHRYFWWQKKADVTVEGGETSWDDLIDSVMTGLGATASVADIDEAYLMPHPSLTSHYEYLPPLLDAIAYSIGRRVVVDLDGTVVLQTPTGARTASLALLDTWREWTLQGGSMATGDNAEPDNLINLWATAPASVTFSYPQVDISISEEESPLDTIAQQTVNLTSVDDEEWYAKSKQRSGSKLVRTTAIRWTDDGVAQNDAELLSLIQKWALDWYIWQLADQNRMLSSIIPWDGTGMADYVEWSVWPELATRVVRGPLNDMANQVYHYTYTDGTCPLGSAFDDFFPARLDCRQDDHGTWVYSWTEMEWTSALAYASVLADGRVGYSGRGTSSTYTTVGDADHAQVEVICVATCGPPLTGGTWTLTNGDISTTDLGHNASASDVQDAIWALAGATYPHVIVTGSMTDCFTLTWPDVGAVVGFTADDSNLTPNGNAQWPATELNNLKIPIGYIVWMKRGFTPARPARVVLDKTATNPDTFSLKIIGATGGTFTIIWDGHETSAIAFDAVDTVVKAAIEAVTYGPTLSSFTGTGIDGDPWIFHVTSGNDSHTVSTGSCNLRDMSGFRFEGPAFCGCDPFPPDVIPPSGGGDLDRVRPSCVAYSIPKNLTISYTANSVTISGPLIYDDSGGRVTGWYNDSPADGSNFDPCFPSTYMGNPLVLVNPGSDPLTATEMDFCHTYGGGTCGVGPSIGFCFKAFSAPTVCGQASSDPACTGIYDPGIVAVSESPYHVVWTTSVPDCSGIGNMSLVIEITETP